ncbi:MAG: DEAD/DEAH box helicase [Candidatus Thermoplasmatota archaeon]|nr:DEAD/DEAH box helicase [Candidatus Thermoplasmatota archaeon]
MKIPQGFPITLRKYQISIAEKAALKNTLVVLPTGLGKTVIAAAVVLQVFGSDGRAIIMAPTRPLVQQHLKEFQKLLMLNDHQISGISGHTGVKERIDLWKRRVAVCTPQVLQNDLKSGYVKLDDVSCLVIDEAHRAVGNYAYVDISRKFMEKSSGIIIALTASPGSDASKFQDIKNSLGIEQVIIKDESDPDIKEYVQDVKITVTKIARPEVSKIVQLNCERILLNLKSPLMELEYFKGRKLNRSTLAQSIPVLSDMAKNNDGSLFRIIPRVSASIRLDTALEYLETQGSEMFFEYIDSILQSEEKTMIRTAELFRADPLFNALLDLKEEAISSEENPKMKVVLRLCREALESSGDSKIIVFTHFRKTSVKLTNFLNGNIAGMPAVSFVGQSRRSGLGGMSQSEQHMVLDDFRNGKKKILVATSVAEEGLDIPQTDEVIFFEPVPSDIRSIQRRGRTGRIRSGQVHILTYEGTRDIGYLYSSQRKEQNMKKMMRSDGRKKNDLYSF